MATLLFIYSVKLQAVIEYSLSINKPDLYVSVYNLLECDFITPLRGYTQVN
jgi:hypothetical protein